MDQYLTPGDRLSGPFSRADLDTMVRLAAAACDEATKGTWRPLGTALESFSDPAEVERLGWSIWAAIEATGDVPEPADTHHIVGSIIVKPVVPASVLHGTPFEPGGNGGRQLRLVGADGNDDAGFSVIQGAQQGATDAHEVNGELAELLALLGDGYSYSGALVLDGGDAASTFRLRPVRRPGRDGGPSHWGVAEDDAAMTFPADRGPLTAALDNDDVECALRTLAELAANGLDDPHDVLSTRQKTIAQRLANLLAAEDDEPTSPASGPVSNATT